MTLRTLSDKLGISVAYLSDIEKGMRYPPDKPLLERFAAELMITGEAKELIFDLAGAGRNEVSSDLQGYIMKNGIVRDALRMARDVGTESDWQQFIVYLKRCKDLIASEC